MNKVFVLLFLFTTAAFAQEKPVTPDRNITYGGVDIEATVDKICTPGYTQTVRNVNSSKKKEVFSLYKGADPNKDSYEVDHLISLELGGNNDITNLWPQSYTIQWNAHDKDRLENKMHKLVCEGNLDLPTAQFEIATDWIKAYKKYIQN